MEVARIDTREPSLRLTLIGPSAEAGRIRLDVLTELAQSVQTVVTRLAYSLRGEPTVRPGRPRADIVELTRLELVAIREGSTVIELGLAGRARPLEAPGLDPGLAAIDSFTAGLDALASGTKLPSDWDHGVSDAARQLSRVYERGVDEIVIEQLGAQGRRIGLTRESVARLEAAPRSPIEGERVEIEGRLLMADFAASRDRARIHRPLAAPVMCTFPQELENKVLWLLRRYVRATGRATVVSGVVRELALDSIEDAEPTQGRSFWELSTLDELAAEQGVEPVDRIEDLVADFWPDDESVDDFLAAIESRD